jgi:diguanylate cyclase (GGDEF)-like protein/PAS domain S-box-containing protein
MSLNINQVAQEKLFNTPFVGIMLLDTDGNVVSCNAKLVAMTGYAPADFDGTCMRKYIHPDYLDKLYSNCKSMESHTRNHPGVFIKFLKKDEEYSDYVVTILNVNDESGSIVGHALYFEPYAADQKDESFLNIDGKEQWVDIHNKDQKEEFLCNIFHGIMDSIIILDVDGNILSYNMKVLELLGVDVAVMSTAGSFRTISADDMNMKVAEKFFRDAFTGEDHSFTWQMKKLSTGRVIDVEVFITKIGKMGEDVLLTTIRDITDKKKITDELENSEKRYRQLVEHSPDGIVIHRKGTVKYVNPAGAFILGGSAEEDILGRPVSSFFKEQDQLKIKERLKKLYEHGQSMPLSETEMIRIDGSIINVEFAAMPFDMDGKVAVQVVIRDVTEKKKQEKYIRYLALHDSLTGLPNRELLADRMEIAVERRKRDELKNAVLYIDLDAFKPINDTLGHDAGDYALKEIAARLEHSVRGTDTAARIGGDEFIVLLEGVDSRQEIEEIASRIRKSINQPIIISEQEFVVGASIGISVYPDDTTDIADLMSYADKAMYQVKDSGKNHYAFYQK